MATNIIKQSEKQKVQQQEQPSKLPENLLYSWNLKPCYPGWKEITSDPVILNIISEGLKTNFADHIPCKGPFEHKHSKRDSDNIIEEIQKLLQKKVMTKYDINEGDYSS